MSFRLPSRKTAAIAVAALILSYLLFAWLALPPLLQSQAEKFVAEKTGHRLTMDKPDFNPFELSLRLHNLRLEEPDGKPLLAFKELLVDVSAASIYRRAYVFDAIRLDGLEAALVELPGDRLNWSALIDALKGKETPAAPAAASAELPRLEVHSLILANGRLDVADRRSAPGVATRVDPIDLELTELSTLPNDKGQYELSARTGFGARIEWQGVVELNPLAVTGTFGVQDISLPKLAALVKLPAKLAPPEGTAGLSARYRVAPANGKIDLTLDQIAAKIAGLKLRLASESEPLLALDTIEAKDGRFDLRQHSVKVGAIAIAGGGARLRRMADGHLDVLDLLPPASAAAATAPEPVKKTAPDWHYRIDRVALTGFSADLRDQTQSPAAQLVLNDIAASVEGISEDLKAPLPVHASFRASAGGSFVADGKVIAAEPAADLQIKLTDLALKPAQPYLGMLTTLTLTDGLISVDGHLNYDAKGVDYKGGVAVQNLRITEGGTRTVFLAWKSLASRNVEATTARLAIGDLTLDGLDTRLIIAKDKSVNLTKILRRPPAAAATAAAKPTAAPAKSAPGYLVNIDRLHIAHSQMEYADYSLALPFGTRIHHLHGNINGLSSRAGAPGQVELDGQVDDYGLARAIGQVDFFNPTDFMDLKVIFRNVEMTRLTPYSATFAGRKIDSGKLSLNLEYKINKRQLSGDNQIVMDSLKLGERVDSPDAKNLPLDLAVALLQDSDGRIDLGLPVSGSLDDPQFSLGGIVWKAIVNVLTKIVTAPFRALGSLFGGGEKLEIIAFEAGRTQLTPPEREKLVKLASALGKRPRLALSVHGAYADADRVALQDLQLRRIVAAKMGQQVNGQTDPGPISTGQPKVQSALEGLYSDRFGGGELAALKDGFRKANPGQLPESATGKVLSRLSGMFREKQTLDEGEVAQLKGADFYAILFQRLRAKESVPDDRLTALAKARGEGALDMLKTAGAPMERVNLLDPEKVDTEGNDVPLKMELSANSKSELAR